LTDLEQHARAAPGRPIEGWTRDFLGIATFQAGLGDALGTAETLRRCLALADALRAARPKNTVTDPNTLAWREHVERTEIDNVMRQASVLLAQVGDESGALQSARRIEIPNDRQSALLEVAKCEAEAGDPAGARLALRAAADAADTLPAAAPGDKPGDAARARAGAAVAAPDLLFYVAQACLETGDRDGEMQTLARAVAAVERVSDADVASSPGYTRARPLLRIAQAQLQAREEAAGIETLKKVVAYADRDKGPIPDDSGLRARADLAQAYARAGRSPDIDALIAGAPDLPSRQAVTEGAAQGFLAAGHVDQAVTLVKGMNAMARTNLLVRAAEVKLAQGDKASASKLAAEAYTALREADPIQGGFDIGIRPRLIKVQGGAGDVAAALATARENPNQLQMGWALGEAAQFVAAAGDDKTATALADGAPNEAKPRAQLGVGLGRLKRGDRSGAAAAFRSAVECAIHLNSAEAANLVIDATAAQSAAGDAAGAAITYAIGARVTALNAFDPHGVPGALGRIADSQITGGDLQGVADWIAALPTSALRRSLYLHVANFLLNGAAQGRANCILHLTAAGPAGPGVAAAPGAGPTAAATFQGKPLQYWMGALRAGGLHRNRPTPQQKDEDALAETAVTALGAIGKSAVPGLIAILKEQTQAEPANVSTMQPRDDADYWRPYRAGKALTGIGADSIPALVEVIKSVPEAMAAYHAASAMFGIGAPASSAVVQLLSDPKPAVRRRAAFAMSNSAIAVTCVPATITASKDADAAVRRLAIGAMQNVLTARRGSEPRIVDALADALSDADAQVRLQASGQLILMQPEALRPIVPKMIAALKATPKATRGTDSNFMVRQSLINALGRSGAPEAAAVIDGEH
jgi:hypothetical protein